MWRTGIRAPAALTVAAVATLVIWSPALRAGLTVELSSDLGEKALNGAVVVVRATDGRSLGPRPATHRVQMEQINRQFRPYILAVPVGVPVEFPNHDRIAHHVYSFSPVRSFEIPLYKGTTPAPIVFDRPGVVPLGCNIHDWMIGYIVVVDAPRFTQVRGREAVFDDLEPGSYEISVWHPALHADHPSTWQVEMPTRDYRAVLTLPEPLLAAAQPAAPEQRIDEGSDY
jgi:plastocyanin